MRLVSLFAASCLVIGLTGCLVSTSDGPVDVGGASDGTLILDWTIDGSTDPDRCNQSSSETLEIIVVPLNGRQSRSFSQTCDLFATSIDLAPGDYEASALLVDSAGQARTTTLDIDPFRIIGNDELSIPIDFPASSFF